MKKLFLVLALGWSLVNAAEVKLSEFESIPALNSKGMALIDVEETKNGLYLLSAVAMSPKGFMYFDIVISKDKETVIVGKVFDANTKQRLAAKTTPEGRDRDAAFKKKVFDEVQSLAPIKYGTGKDVYYVFTDPDCPYCRKFDEIEHSLGEYATFYIFPMHLAIRGHYQESVDSVLALPEEKRYDALHKHLSASSTQKPLALQLSMGNKQVVHKLNQNIKRAASLLGARGTPSVYDSNGKKIKWDRLPAKYKKATPSLSLSKEARDFIKQKPELSFHYGSGEKTLYLLTDPDSVGMRNLHSSELMALIKKRHDLIVVPYARGKKSVGAVDVLISQDKAKAFERILISKRGASKNKALWKKCQEDMPICSGQLYQVNQLAKQVGVFDIQKGYAFFDADGKGHSVESLLK